MISYRSFFVAMIAAAVAVGCGGSDTSAPSDDPAPGVLRLTVASSASILVPAQTATAVVTATLDGQPTSADGVSLNSSNTAVATVSAAREIAALAPGVATITATLRGSSATVQVHVSQGGMVGASGGTVRTADGKLQLTIPAGALSQLTPVALATASIGVDPSMLDGSAFQVGTGALTFAQPVTIEILFQPQNAPLGVRVNAIGVRRATPSGGWTDIRPSAIDLPNTRATAPITQAGTYAVGRQVPETPCIGDNYRAFDFWLGGWFVTAGGVGAGQNTITAEPGGCAILEEYVTPTASSPGRSINFYDAEAGEWYQTYIDASGFRVMLVSTSFSANTMVMRTPGGGVSWQRWTWSRTEDGRVRQVGDFTTNNGATFGAPFWDGLYARR